MADKQKKANAEKNDDNEAAEPTVQVSQSPDLRKMAEAEMRQPSPAEIAVQYEAAEDKDAFTPQYVAAGVPAHLMGGAAASDDAGVPATEATTTGGAGGAATPTTAGAGGGANAADTTTTTVDAPAATPGTTTTTTGRAAGGTGGTGTGSPK